LTIEGFFNEKKQNNKTNENVQIDENQYKVPHTV